MARGQDNTHTHVAPLNGWTQPWPCSFRLNTLLSTVEHRCRGTGSTYTYSSGVRGSGCTLSHDNEVKLCVASVWYLPTSCCEV